MIDFVRCHSQIPLTPGHFVKEFWNPITLRDGSMMLWHRTRAVSVHYYLNTKRLVISGKLITLLHDTQVSNFDDLYGDLREQFIDEFNAAINCLFTMPVVDIRNFEVTRIDYCFNVETPYVTQYIDFLTTAFERTNTGGRRINHTARCGLHSSVYIKNATEYEQNRRYNYTLNVYDKTDRLHYQRNRRERISEADFALAENILRIEVQASHNLINTICQEFSVSRRFEELFDYRIAFWTICKIFDLVYRMKPQAQIYTYKEALRRVRKGSAAQKTLYSAATNHPVLGKQYAYGRKALTVLDIYPYCLLSKASPVPLLPTPMQLIVEKDGMYIEE